MMLAIIISSATISTNSITQASVPSDAATYKGHYYKVYNKSMNWSTAKSYCQNKGGHLVTITTLGEQNFVADLMYQDGNKNCYWLGAHKSVNGNWRWVTNEFMPFANWAKKQPDNYTGEEDCLMMYRRQNPSSSTKIGQWNDIASNGDCKGEEFFGTRNFGFICEWDSNDDSNSGNGRYDRHDRYNEHDRYNRHDRYDKHDNDDEDDNYHYKHRHRNKGSDY